MRDLRYAFRTLVRNPGFSIAAVLVLALGIGANSAIFTVCARCCWRRCRMRNPIAW